MQDGRYEQLREYLSDYLDGDVMVASSGGVDSALLLYTVCQLAKEKKEMPKVYAVTIQTRMHPGKDVQTARELAEAFGAEFQVIELDELQEVPIEYNPKNRCYLCKKAFFEKMTALAQSRSVRYILEGTNADDLTQYRPGIQALRELGIISPLAQCRLTKADVRCLAGQLGIAVAERPSSPCLATRLPYGDRITYALLERIDAGENCLRRLGYRNVRLRVHGVVARIEVDRDALERFMGQREEIVTCLKQFGFLYITVDLEGFRSGSMDI